MNLARIVLTPVAPKRRSSGAAGHAGGEPGDHPFHLLERDAAARNWREESRAPALFDGKMVFQRRLDFQDGAIRGTGNHSLFDLPWWRSQPAPTNGFHLFGFPVIVSQTARSSPSECPNTPPIRGRSTAPQAPSTRETLSRDVATSSATCCAKSGKRRGSNSRRTTPTAAFCQPSAATGDCLPILQRREPARELVTRMRSTCVAKNAGDRRRRGVRCPIRLRTSMPPPCCRSSTGSSPATADAVACTRAAGQCAGTECGEERDWCGDTASMTCLPTASLQAIALCRLRRRRMTDLEMQAIDPRDEPLRDSLRDAGRKCDAHARIRIFTGAGTALRGTPDRRHGGRTCRAGRGERCDRARLRARGERRPGALPPSGCAKRGELCRIRPAAHSTGSILLRPPGHRRGALPQTASRSDIENHVPSL